MFAAKRLGKELTKVPLPFPLTLAIERLHPACAFRLLAASVDGNKLTPVLDVQAKHSLPPGIDLVKADDFREWQVDIRVLDANPLYLNQTYRLSFIFSNNYPIEAPEVAFIYVPPSPAPTNTPQSTSQPPQSQSQSQTQPSQTEQPFSGRPIPIHPHIYSNGIICLDLLGSAGWSPVQSVESVCMSIQSMLTGNTKNERPQGDEAFCQSMGVRGPEGWSGWRGGRGRGLKDVRFAYDDDTV